MVQDVYGASWQVLQSLNRYGSNVANQIILHTKIGSRTTLYKALDLLLDEDLIMIGEKKVYSINTINYQNQSQFLKLYDEYQNLVDNTDEIFAKLSDKWKNHKQVLNPYSDSDKELAREVITKPAYYDLISSIVRLFELGSLMDFFINADVFSKTIERKAISLRGRNEKVVSKFLNIIKKAEPVLWGETVMLIQTRLATKISPA